MKKTILLCVDEVDYLFNRDQDIIYNIFNWPHLKKSKIGVISIANTFDFPERLIQRI